MKRKWTTKEKVLVGAVAAMLCLLIVKSVFLDPIRVEDEKTAEIVAVLEEMIDKKYDSWLYRTPAMTVRIIDVEPVGTSDFKGHYRKYFAGFFPVGDVYFSSNEEMR